MYVCICNALSEKKLREAASVLGSSATASELFRSLGSRPQCGKCVPEVRGLLDQHKGHRGGHCALVAAVAQAENAA